jgi:hypothetical protein
MCELHLYTVESWKGHPLPNQVFATSCRCVLFVSVVADERTSLGWRSDFGWRVGQDAPRRLVRLQRMLPTVARMSVGETVGRAYHNRLRLTSVQTNNTKSPGPSVIVSMSSIVT